MEETIKMKSLTIQHFVRLLNNFVTGFQATLNLKYTIEEYTVVNALQLAISKKITLLESLYTIYYPLLLFCFIDHFRGI